jgi:hypothetical protein
MSELQAELGERVEFVWHGVNDAHNLREFLRSPVRWAEVDIRLDLLDRVVLRHDSFTHTPPRRGERVLLLVDCLEQVREHGRSAKLDFKENSDAVERALGEVERLGFDDRSLWFNSAIECLGADGFRSLAARHPGATMSCPVDFLAPLVLAAPDVARNVVGTLRGWGVNRFSLSWKTERFHDVFGGLEAANCDVNIYGIPDLAAFIEAAQLLPRSVTADFNFPEWGYRGRGSGERKTGGCVPDRTVQ